MTRKRARKLLMALGYQRNAAAEMLDANNRSKEPNDGAVKYITACLGRYIYVQRRGHLARHKWFTDILG